MDNTLDTNTHLLDIIDNMPYMAWYKDANGRFLVVNQLFADSCGLPKEDILGKTDFDVWPYELAKKYSEDDAEVMRSRTKKSVEEIIDGQDGRQWFETSKSPIINAEGVVIGTTGVSKNISTRKLFQIGLEKQQQFIKAMMDATPDYIFYKDINGAYLGCNHNFSNLFFGLTEKEIIGKHDVELIKDTELLNSCQQADLTVFAHAKPLINEEFMQLMDGR